MSIQAAKDFIHANLAECCSELLEWHKTGLLPGDKVRSVWRILQSGGIGEHDACMLGENMVERAAMEDVVQRSIR